MDIKGVEVKVGDYISFDVPRVSLPEVQAVITKVEDDGFWVFSPAIPFWVYSHKFAIDEVGEIDMICPADIAVRTQSGGRFSPNQRVWARSTFYELEPMEGRVVAALDGIVVVVNDEGRRAIGGGACWEPFN